MNRYFLLLFLIATIALTSCHKKLANINFNFLDKKKLEVNGFDFDYFSSKAKIKFQDKSKHLNTAVNIRIRKDSVIWLSLSPTLGVEAARGMITRDSIHIIDRINKNYISFSFDNISKRYDFQINYDLVQAMIIGNMPISRTEQDKLLKEGGYYIIKQQKEGYEISNAISMKDMKVQQIHIVKDGDGVGLTLAYEDFKILEEELFPHSNIVDLKFTTASNRGDVHISITHHKTAIEKKKLKFPFHIPSKYVRK